MITLALRSWRTNMSGYLTVIAATIASSALICGLFTVIFAAAGTDPDSPAEGSGSLDSEFLAAMSGWSVMLGAFATIFVISSTLAFVLDARSRELGLLRLVGAEPRQVKRMVRWEVLICAAIGTVIGSLFAVPVADLVRDGLASVGGLESDLALPWTIGAFLSTLGLSLLSAFAGASGPGRRAGRTSPMAALGQATPARRAIGWGRWAMVVLSGGGVIFFSVAPWSDWGADIGAQISLILLASCLLVAAVAGLAPLAVPVAAGAIGTLLAAISPGPGMLSQADARFRARRSAALAAPIILAVGSYVALATIVTTQNATMLETDLDAVVVSDSGLNEAELRALCAEQTGVRACTALAETVLQVEASGSSGSASLAIIDPETVEALSPLVASGSLGDIAGDAVGFSTFVEDKDAASLILPSGEQRPVSAAAEIEDWMIPQFWPDYYVSFDQAAAWGLTGDNQLWLIPADGTSPAELAGAMRSAGAPGEILTGADIVAERANAQAEQNRQAIFAILGAAIVLALVSVVVTSLLSARDQRGAITLMRRVGASPGQVLAAAAGDIALVVTVAGLSTLLIPLWAIWQVSDLGIARTVVVPWGDLGAILGISAALAMVTTLAGTAWQLRRGLE